MNRYIAGLFVSVGLLVVFCINFDIQLFAASKEKQKQSSAFLTYMQDETAMFEDELDGDMSNGHIAVDTFDLKKKQQQVQMLLARAVDFCENNSLIKSCHAFTHTKDFVEGELYIFLMDTKGMIYAHGEQEYLIWNSLWNYKDTFGALAMQSMIATARDGGGWVTYEWRDAIKVSSVKLITIEGKNFVIGCGYYPHSKKYAAIGLVKGAVSLFNQEVKAGRPIEQAFSSMGYQLSERFVFGDLYLYALDFDGVIRAQGDDPNLIGLNVLDRKDAKGKAINKEAIEMLKKKNEGQGIWFDYTSKGALKYTYAEKVKDAQGKEYFIACGYYPEVIRDNVIDLVRRGYQFMKASGTSAAAKAFTEKSDDAYRFGDLYLFVYDLKGKCIAHGKNPALMGKNMFDEKDEDGVFYVREIIEQAKVGGGWLDFKFKNSFQATYVEQIDMGVDSYVIGSATFPVAKPETMTLLVKSAISYLETHEADEAFSQFVVRESEFIRGDLSIFAIDTDGYCYAWSDEKGLIWKNVMKWQDDDGKPFIKQMLDQAMHGAGYFVYKFNKYMRVNYVEQVEKNGKTYLVGSGFYK